MKPLPPGATATPNPANDSTAQRFTPAVMARVLRLRLVQPLVHAALDVLYALQQLLPQALVGRHVLRRFGLSCCGHSSERYVARCRLLHLLTSSHLAQLQ